MVVVVSSEDWGMGSGITSGVAAIATGEKLNAENSKHRENSFLVRILFIAQKVFDGLGNRARVSIQVTMVSSRDMGNRFTTCQAVAMARRKYPGAQVSLDALCRRFEIDNSNRSLHGALIDADLLASVYLELIGGRQPDLMAPPAEENRGAAATGDGPKTIERIDRVYREPRPHAPSPEEAAAHAAFLEKLKSPIWLNGAGS